MYLTNKIVFLTIVLSSYGLDKCEAINQATKKVCMILYNYKCIIIIFMNNYVK